MKGVITIILLALPFFLCISIPICAADTMTPTPGNAWAWGANYSGEVGDCTLACRTEPFSLADYGPFVSIEAGGSFTTALKVDGTVWSWGNNGFGQLGDGTTTNRPCPVQTTGIQDVVAIAAGGEFAVALKRDGTVWAWGWNTAKEAGICDPLVPIVTQPNQVQNLSDIIAIEAGLQHGVALRADGTVWCWGYGNLGILGQGDHDYWAKCSGVQVLDVSGATAIAAGGAHSLVLLSDGTVKAWGQGDAGQLGIDFDVSMSFPQTVHNIDGVVAVAAGNSHSLAIRFDGTLWGWGRNSSGQLGTDLPSTTSHPVQLTRYEHASAISSGPWALSSLVQTEDGTLWLLTTLGICGIAPPPARQIPLPTAQQFSSDYYHFVILEGPAHIRPPGLSSMRKRINPYRIEAVGYGLQPGFKVYLDDDETPWTKVSIDSPTQFTLKGGNKLKARIKSKIPFPFRIVNPDGGQVRALWDFTKKP